jgi:regulatory protein YycI of two-component signal transduction system YycFG
MHIDNSDTETIQIIIFVFLVIVIILFQLFIPKHVNNHLIIDKYLGLKKKNLKGDKKRRNC